MISYDSTQFFYRSNSDGTVDSICGLCFLTVVTANTFTQLKTSENVHRCPYKLSGSKKGHPGQTDRRSIPAKIPGIASISR